MKVAPSFAAFEIVTPEPYTKNGKLYTKVKNPSTGNTRECRLYTDEEYAKLYSKSPTPAPGAFPNLKKVRGFSKGPIMVVRGNRASDEAYLGSSSARCAVGIDWYFISENPIPADLPSHLTLVPLTWEEFNNDGKPRPAKELASIITCKMKKIML